MKDGAQVTFIDEHFAFGGFEGCWCRYVMATIAQLSCRSPKMKTSGLVRVSVMSFQRKVCGRAQIFIHLRLPAMTLAAIVFYYIGIKAQRHRLLGRGLLGAALAGLAL